MDVSLYRYRGRVDWTYLSSLPVVERDPGSCATARLDSKATEASGSENLIFVII